MTTKNWDEDEFIKFFNDKKEIITGSDKNNYDQNSPYQKTNLQNLINKNHTTPEIFKYLIDTILLELRNKYDGGKKKRRSKSNKRHRNIRRVKNNSRKRVGGKKRGKQSRTRRNIRKN